MRMRMNRLPLLLSLLALAALGPVACGGGDDDQSPEASQTKTTHYEPQTKIKRLKIGTHYQPCGSRGRYRFAVVKGDVSCRAARGVMRGWVNGRFPGPWGCDGPDSEVVCLNEGGEMIMAVCCGTTSRWIKHRVRYSKK
jgi:hypothetical protein